MLFAQIQQSVSQPLLIAIIVICAVNLLITFVLLSRLSGNRIPETESIRRPEPGNDTPAAPRRSYAGNSDVNSEIAAVISTALHLYKNEYHDFENTVLTIQKVSKAYSPWSSKLYGLSKNPR